MRRRNRQRGSSIVELSISLLVFMVTLIGIMDFGRIAGAYNILAGATKEGARYAIVHGSMSGSAATNSDIQSIVQHWAIGLDPGSLNVTTTWAPGNTPGSTVQVVATYTITPILIWISGSSFTISSQSKMIISQ